MKIGAHVSSAGGISKAIDRGVEIGAEAVQLFCSPPQGWAFKSPSEDEVIAFRQKSEEMSISPAFLHGIYLMNFGSPDPALVSKSIAALVNYMGCASQIGAQGVIFHCGSHKGAGYDAILKQTTNALAEALHQSSPDIQLIIKNQFHLKRTKVKSQSSQNISCVGLNLLLYRLIDHSRKYHLVQS